MPRCHSGEEISPVDGVEGVRNRPVVGKHHCAVWVEAEGGVDGVPDVFGPAWGPDPEPQRGEALRRGAA
jgi:hypothetical protein